MSLRFRTRAAWLAPLCALAVAGCDRTQHQPGGHGAPAGAGMNPVPASALIPGGGHLPSGGDSRAAPYYNNAEAVQRGMRLYNQMNCVGCHFNGGGGIGPPLMDNKWIYGGRLDQIFNSIYQGRPNGMPVWGGKIPDQQIWEIATYVRSMSLPQTLAANGSGTPSQRPVAVPPEADQFGGWQVPEAKDAQAPAGNGSPGKGG